MAGAIVALNGCAPNVELVYVDLSRPTEVKTEADAPVLFTVDGIPSASQSTLGRGPSTLMVGVSADRYLAAIKENQASRQRSMQALADSLFGALDAQIEDARRAAKTVLSAEEELFMNDAVARTRPVFEKYADETGRLTLELSRLAEFPSLAPKGDPASARAQRAEQIRAELHELESRYIAERDAVFAEVQNRLMQKRAALEAQLDLKRAQEVKRIEATVAAMQSRGAAATANPALARLQFTVPPVQGSQSSLPSIAGRTEVFRSKLPRPASRLSLKTQAETWAALNGYKLTSDPRKGADKSKEFWAWRSALQHGP